MFCIFVMLIFLFWVVVGVVWFFEFVFIFCIIEVVFINVFLLLFCLVEVCVFISSVVMVKEIVVVVKMEYIIFKIEFLLVISSIVKIEFGDVGDIRLVLNMVSVNILVILFVIVVKIRCGFIRM